MKTTAILTATLGLALGSLHAQTVPPFINYQGRVTDSVGVGLGTGTPVNRKVIFRIFDAPTAGSRLWSEQHTVTISNGEFSVLLGNGINANYAGVDEVPLKTTTPLDTVFTSAGILRYVEIVVDNGDNTLNAGDAPIAPRQQITSTAYSFRARSADTIASGTDLQLNGSANYGLGYYGATRLFNGAAVDGPVLFGQSGGALGSVNGSTKNIALRWNAAGAVGIGSADLTGASAATKLVLQGDDSSLAPQQLNIRGNSDTNKRLLLGYNTTSNYGSLQAYSGISTATNLLLNPSGGNVGIGVTAPLAGKKLHVAGSSYFDGSVNIVSPDIATVLTIQSPTAGGYGLRHTNGASWLETWVSPGQANLASTDTLNILAASTLSLFTNNTQRLVVNSTGNVGIGTTNPDQKLHVFGGYANLNGLRLSGQDPFNTIYHPTADIAINTHSASQSVKIGSNVSGTALTVKNSNVGIGVTNPTRGRLEVVGAVGLQSLNAIYLNNLGPSGYTYYNNLGAGGNGDAHVPLKNHTAGANFGVSIYATADIAALGFAAFSDARIKIVHGRSNGALDLTTLDAIEITDYTFKDVIGKGNRLKKKVIAQQLETVFPQAVSRITDVVPDIYEIATLEDGWMILATDLKVGERVRLIGDKSEGIHEVLEVEAGRFRTDFAAEGDEVFVYGREVNDFRSVDYDAISMLNVSATQELARKLDEKNTRIADLEKRLATLEAKDQARDAKMASIEQRLAAASPSTVTVSLKQGE